MRPIDADALINRMYHDAFETDTDMQKWDSGCWIRYKMFKNAIDEQPTIEQKQEWIPCEERLPIDGEWCLVSVNAIDDIPYEIVISDKVSYCYERGWATAWMPLPKPYMKGL